MAVFILILILIVTIIAFVMMVSIVWGLIVTGGVPFISTNKKDFFEICLAADIKNGERVYDLGCGKAHFLVYAAKKFGAIGVGYELTLYPYLWSRVRILLNKVNVVVFRKNFFDVNLKEADVVFCYLFPKIMKKLEPKFEAELRPGSRVVSYSFKLPNRKPDKEIVTNDDNTELGRIYVYNY